MRRLVRAAATATLALLLTASVALAHPLGNFTINHYAGIRVEPDRIVLDVVIDAAEIPTFQATAGLDRDGDGALSAAETVGLPQARCLAIGRDLALAVDGTLSSLRLVAAGTTLPTGNAGLPTMRSACVFEAPSALSAAGPAEITFRDGFEAARIGWREITAVGDGVTLDAVGVPVATVSDRLLAYPAGLAAAPDARAASLTVRAGGARLAPFTAPDATPIPPVMVAAGVAVALEAPSGPGTSGTSRSPEAPGPVVDPGSVTAVVPGGADPVPGILGQAPVSPVLAVIAMLTAALLGAGHALTPGHGKTLMAAYLVGTRGTPRHALGLGLAVSISHTAGILVLALVILAAESTLPADVVVRTAPVIAAVSILVIGAWMLATELRRRRADRADRAGHHHPDHEADGHDHVHTGDYAHTGDHAHDHGRPPAHGDGTGHTHPTDETSHRHGPITHSHVPRTGTTVTWRGLFLLGLAGGLVPSANALLILLGSIAAGRPAWGVLLVAAFGLGMAGVMTGIGLACVYARGLVGRMPVRGPLRAAGRLVPLGAAVLVLALGLVLTTQAVASARLG